MEPRIAAIILAAGYSSRMGELKPLLELAGVTALQRCVDLFREAGIVDVRVVTGHRREELAPLLRRMHAREVVNERYPDGMFSSVKTGVVGLDAGIDAFFVLPVDLPLVRTSTVRLLAKEFLKGEGAVFYPAFSGERGHPPLVAKGVIPEILESGGSGGLKEILDRWSSQAREVDVADEQILHDMDTPGDYRTLLARVEQLHVPSAAESGSLLSKYLKPHPEIIRHCEAVAEVAVNLGKELIRAGCKLDLPLLQAAALLHDLARTAPGHARAGARILREAGFPEVAELVATHMDMSLPQEEPVTEAAVVFLADKLVLGDRRVSLEKRFSSAAERFGDDPAIGQKIAGRLATAAGICDRIETLLGHPLA